MNNVIWFLRTVQWVPRHRFTLHPTTYSRSRRAKISDTNERAAIANFLSFLTSTTYIFSNSHDVTNVKAKSERRKFPPPRTSYYTRSSSSLIPVLLGDRLEIDSLVRHVGRHSKLVRIDQRRALPCVRSADILSPTLINLWHDWLILWLTVRQYYSCCMRRQLILCSLLYSHETLSRSI